MISGAGEGVLLLLFIAIITIMIIIIIIIITIIIIIIIIIISRRCRNLWVISGRCWTHVFGFTHVWAIAVKARSRYARSVK